MSTHPPANLVVVHSPRDGGAVPVSLLRAEISGLVSVVDRLARRGPAGVAEATELLGRLLTALHETVVALGGEVVQCTGETLLAIWPATGDDLAQATQRAARAGLELHTALRNAAIDARVRLRAGVGTGEATIVRLGLWEQYIQVLAGGAVVQAAAALVHAQPGETMLAPYAWNLVAPLCDGEPLPDGSARIDAVELLDPPPVQARLPTGALSLAPDHLLRVGPVTLLQFAIGLLANTQASRAESVRWIDQLEHLLNLVASGVGDHEGPLVVRQVNGASLLVEVLFKHQPDTPLNAPAAAVQTALRIHADLLQARIAATCAVASGPALSGMVGGGAFQCFAVIGAVTQIAAQLMHAATEATILCDEATAHAAQEQVVFETLPPIAVPGRQSTMPIYRPENSRPPAQTGGLRAPETARSLGRAAERAVLEQRVAALLGPGAGNILVIEGEPGIGKSHLVGELVRAARSRGVLALVGAGDPVERAAPYHAWRTIVGRLLHLGASDDPAQRREQVLQQLRAAPDLLRLAPLLNALLPIALPDNELTATMNSRARADNLALLVTRLMQATTRLVPTLLVIEDAHWLDTASWGLLLALSRRVDALQIVLATRPLAELPPEYHQLLATGAERLRLGPLPAEDIHPLICLRLGCATLPEPVAQLVVARAGGNPLYSLELAAWMRDAGVVTVEDGACRVHDTPDLPVPLLGVIAARVERLAPLLRLTLGVVAVFGRTARAEALYGAHPELADRTTIRTLLDELVARDMLVLDESEAAPAYAFRHNLIRDVAYELLSGDQRRVIHRAAAAWYSRIGAAAPVLAHHYERAGALEEARQWLERAGSLAASGSAQREAAEYFARALALTPPDERTTRFRLLVALAAAHEHLGERRAAEREIEEIEALAAALGDDHCATRAALQRTIYAESIGDGESARAAAARAVELALRAGDVAIETEALLALGRVLRQHEHAMAARARLEQARDLARTARLTNLEAMVLLQLGLALAAQGQYEEARADLDRALRQFRATGDLRGEGEALDSLGVVARAQGAVSDARTYFDLALRLARAVGDTAGEARARASMRTIT